MRQEERPEVESEGQRRQGSRSQEALERQRQDLRQEGQEEASSQMKLQVCVCVRVCLLVS